jgi:3-methyl-2-oxobutanoate hydroxymethyltransferase
MLLKATFISTELRLKPRTKERDSMPIAETLHMNVADIQKRKTTGQPICSVTCYDYPTARWVDAAGIELILVGDSVGTNVLGYASEKDVTLNDMTHHVRAVCRGAESSYILADLPYGTCDTPEAALANAKTLIDAGADGVKLEGFKPEIVSRLVAAGIDVCAHLGLMPQIHEKKALQARSADAALTLVQQSIEMEKAGAWCLVLELIPEEVAEAVSRKLTIPTIGIGAGRYTDGQVLILLDVLGFHGFDFQHNHRFADIETPATTALQAYASAVRDRTFPGAENTRHLSADELSLFTRTLAQSVPPPETASQT